MMDKKTYKLSELAKIIGGNLEGEDIEVSGVSDPFLADKRHISYIENERFLASAKESSAAAFLTFKKLPIEKPQIIAVPIEPAIIKLLKLYELRPTISGIHPSAVVESKLPPSVTVGANTYIGKNVSIGENTIIYANVSIGDNVNIGQDCIIWYGVVIRENVKIGNRVIIHPNATIGADGFGYYFIDGRHEKIPHIGTVEIGDDVEIGANTCIDRAKVGKTIIGKGTKIDNLAQIGHNVWIGENAIIIAQVGLAGSVKVGDFSILGGKAGVADHIQIGKQAKIAAYSAVSKNVADGKIFAGVPASEHTQFLERERNIKKISLLVKKIKELEQSLADLQRTINNIKTR